MGTSTAWRPPQWSNPAMVQLVVPPSTTISSSSSSYTNADIQNAQIYVFDAVFRLAHTQRIEKTQHPIQTGANISSHAYLLPPSVEMEIGMSDAMQEYASDASSGVVSWGQAGSKSVNAYQKLLQLQQARTPLTLITRLRQYQNMLIVSIEPVEDFKTMAALRARVLMETILTASVSSVPVTEAIHDTQSTSMGTQTGTTPNTTTLSRYQIDTSTQRVVNVPGAGTCSSIAGVSPTLNGLLSPYPPFPGVNE